MGQVRRIEAMGVGTRLAMALGLSLGLAAAVPGGARGDGPAAKCGELAGKRVVARHRGFVLQDVPNGRGRAATSAGDIYLVERVEGSSVRLRPDAGPAGWAAADQVVPVERAVAAFSDAIGSNPRDAYAYAMRGKILLVEREDAEHALADCDEAIRLDPNDPLAYEVRGLVRSVRQEFDKAVADYSQVIRLRPDSAPAYGHRGAAYTSRQEFDKALADFSQAIRIDPRDADAFLSRALTFMAMEQPDKAIADFDQAIRLNPQDLDAYAGRAAARRRRARLTRPSPTTRRSSAWSRRPPWRTIPGRRLAREEGL